MQKEIKVLMWSMFGVGITAVGVVPAWWGMTKHTTAVGVVQNAQMAKVLWGSSPQVSSYISDAANGQGSTSVPIIPGAMNPHISAIVWNASSWPPKVTIEGYGFGNPPSGVKTFLSIENSSRGWLASSTGGVKPDISLWRNDKIVISGFSGDYGGNDTTAWSDGLGSFVFALNDNVQVQVTNPQTGKSGTGDSTFPNQGTLPTITLNSLTSMVSGQSQNITGKITLNGQPLANQSVNVSVNMGTLGGQVYRDQPSEFYVYTDASGDFSIPYTANGSGNVTATVQVDGESVNESMQVYYPVPTLQVSTRQLYTNQTLQLTATCSNLPPGFQLGVFKVISGANQTLSKGGTSWVAASDTESSAQTISYFSAVMDSSGNIITRSLDTNVTWNIPYSVTLVATGDQTNNIVTLTATSSYPLNGHTMQIINGTTGQVLASTTQGTTLTTQITAIAQQTQSFQAIIIN